MKSRQPGRSRPARTILRTHTLGDRVAGSFARRLRCELLEDRRMLAVVTVTTVADTIDFNDGKTSLREAIFATNTVPGADEIRFDPVLFAAGPATILLAQGELKITDPLTITGPGAELLTIDASTLPNTAGTRIFTIDTPLATLGNVLLSRITLTGGQAGDGGAIFASANLTVADARLVDNHASHAGGAIFMNLGRLELVRAELADNSATAQGGAVSVLGEALVTDSDFLRNSAGSGGALVQSGFDKLMHIAGSRFTSNTAGSGGALDASNGPLVIESSVFTTNAASSVGGAIRALTASNYPDKLVLITGSTISNNTAGKTGGGLTTGGRIEIHASTISGNSATGDGRGGGIYHGSAPGTVGLLVEKSAISGNSALYGGGIFIVAGSTNILASTIANNAAGAPGNNAGRGGGVYNAAFGLQAKLIVQDSTISGNNATRDGGGVYGGSGALIMSNSTITGNSTGSVATKFGAGGGLCFSTSGAFPPRILNSTISDNVAGRSGGGLYTAGILLIDSCTIARNIAGNNGGGVYARNAVTISRSLLTENRAGDPTAGVGFGGAVHFVGAPGAVIDSSTLSGNLAGRGGGGISGAVAVTVINSTISGNTAHTGGGAQGDGITFRHSTITDNSAIFINGDLGDGGGIFGRITLLDHAILAGNHADGDSPDLVGNLGVASRFNLISDIRGSDIAAEAPIGAPDANGNLIGGPIHGIIDPLLGPLADNGGPTLTHALLPGSPAIEAGDPAFAPGVGGAPEFDQRGAAAYAVGGARIDIGAFEVQPAGGALSADFDFSGFTDGGDFLAWQRNFGKPSAATFRQGDATADGDIDSSDLAVWAARFGDHPGETASAFGSAASNLTLDQPPAAAVAEPTLRASALDALYAALAPPATFRPLGRRHLARAR